MTHDERDALDALERAAMRDQGANLWPILTSYRAGGSLVEALGLAVSALAEYVEETVPSEDLVEQAQRAVDYAREHARDAERAAEEAESAAEEADEALAVLLSRRKKGAAR